MRLAGEKQQEPATELKVYCDMFLQYIFIFVEQLHFASQRYVRLTFWVSHFCGFR